MALTRPGAYLFYVGLLLLAHAVYAAVGGREALQAWHHGHGAAPPALLLLAVGAEAVVGAALAMVGFVRGSALSEARLAELTRHDRYDRSMFTGVGFIHFNHRGTLGAAPRDGEEGRAPEATPSGGKPDRAKKTD